MGRKGLAIALVAAAGLATTPALATTGYSIRSDVDDILYRIEMENGQRTAIGPVGGGFGDVEALAFHPDGTLFGFDDTTNQLITLNLATGAGTAVGPSGISVTDIGLDFDCQVVPYLSTDAPTPENLFKLDVSTGAGTAIGVQGQKITGLGFDGQTLFGLSGDNTNQLRTLDRGTGTSTLIGPTGIDLSDGGLAVAANGVLWGIEDSATGRIFTLDKGTGTATQVTTTGVAGFEGLAIDSPSLCNPPTASVNSGPEGLTNNSLPTFGFSVGGQPNGQTVECALDGAYSPCSPPEAVAGPLADGAHIFGLRVTARDGIQASAERSFTVDTDPPDSSFKKKPKKRTRDETPTFRLLSDEPGSTFMCMRDKKPYRSCEPKTTLKIQREGKHVLRVLATDPAGNGELEPSKAKFRLVE